MIHIIIYSYHIVIARKIESTEKVNFLKAKEIYLVNPGANWTWAFSSSINFLFHLDRKIDVHSFFFELATFTKSFFPRSIVLHYLNYRYYNI